MDFFILLKEFRLFVATYKELFILLGTIILVWLVVVIIIKKLVRKDERSNILKNHIDDDEWNE